MRWYVVLILDRAQGVNRALALRLSISEEKICLGTDEMGGCLPLRGKDGNTIIVLCLYAEI